MTEEDLAVALLQLCDDSGLTTLAITVVLAEVSEHYDDKLADETA